MPDAWSDERIEQLKKLWRQGKTAAAIGAALGGLSRSAVLGKVFRLRLGPAGDTAVRQESRDVAAEIGSPSRRRGSRRRSQDSQAPAKPRGKSLLELTNDSCRWPHGRPGTANFHFCGAASADLEHGIPYCAQHMRRAYTGAERIPADSVSITAVSALTGAWTSGVPQRERFYARATRSARS
jgi:GcrA cell cycle regulator